MKYVLILFLMIATPVWAVEPNEVLSDPVLETRAREISKNLRCLVCRNENIDSSNADIARDLRLLVRERLLKGDSDTEVLAYIVARYGEYVLLKPPLTAKNLILWLIGPALLVLGLLLAGLYIKKASQAPPKALSKEEMARLNSLLKD